MQPSGENPSSPVPVPPSPELRTARLRIRSVLRGAVAAIALLGAAVALGFYRPVARGVLLIGLMSIGMAYVVAPTADRLSFPRHRDRGPLTLAFSVLLVYAVLLILGIAIWTAAAGPMQHQLGDLRAQWPLYTERARQRLEMIERIADRFSPGEPLAAHVRTASRATADFIRTQVTTVSEEVRASQPVLPWLWLAPVVTFVLITRFSWFRNSAVAHLPEGHLRWRGEEFFLQLNSLLAGYTRAQLWSTLIVGVVCPFGFRLIGVPYALLLGTISGLLESLPVVGPLTAAIVACTLVSGERLFVLLGFLLALRLAQDYFVYPRLASRGMHLHPMAIIAAILAGAELGGMLGVLVSVPLVGIASLTFRHWREYWAIEKLVRNHSREQSNDGMRSTTDEAADGSAAAQDAHQDRLPSQSPPIQE